VTTDLVWAARLPAPWVCLAVVAAVLPPTYLLMPFAVQALLYPTLGMVSVGAIGWGIYLHRPSRPAPWVLVAGGILLWVLGDIAYAAYELLRGAAPFPSLADALYLSGYLVVAGGLGLSVRRSGVRDAVAWQDAGICVVGATLLSWEWLLEPSLTGEDSGLAQLVALANPAFDLVLLLMLVRLVSSRGRTRGVYVALALAIVCYLVSDVFYGIQSLAGTYRTGGPVDLGWVVCYLAIGAIALHPRMVELTDPGVLVPRTSSRLRLLLLGAVALLAPGMLVVQHVYSDHVDVLLIAAGATLLFCLTTLRGAGLLRDVEQLATELRGREQEMQRRATTDALTGLANRAVLHERLERDVAAGAAFCVALLDLDDFKHVNDSLGHEAGDELLLQVSARLTRCLHEQDLVVRLGGDEFAVVSASGPEVLGEQLLGCFNRSMPVAGSDRLVRASIGVAASDGGATSASVLLRNADIAMYVTKSAGGGGSTVYRPEMSAELMARLETRRQLAEAVEQEQFVAWLQPVVDLASYRLRGFEALTRWERPGQPPVPPGGWIVAAEETGLVVAIDELVLRAAVRQLVEWSDTIPGAASLDLAVNASGRSLAEPDVAERVLQVLRDEGLSPSRLVLEVTEGVLIDEEVGLRLQLLRDAGVRIALDDFGTGWSSLAYLRRFPVDVLKIDRSFVRGIAGGSGAEALPAAVLQMAAALGLDVIAEGVETPEQLQVLRRLGCRTAQGYLLGLPAPAAEHEELVRRGRIEGGPSVVAVHARPA
jgi:diguanylate cyclase (GGDEF)-like protein